jgi:hypothetical protein
LSGVLTHPELVTFQTAAADFIRQQGRMSFLILVHDFEGWETEGDWGDLSFMSQFDALMDKMAIVVDPKWNDLTLIFVGKGFRQCQVECFAPEDSAKALAWVLAKA